MFVVEFVVGFFVVCLFVFGVGLWLCLVGCFGGFFVFVFW